MRFYFSFCYSIINLSSTFVLIDVSKQSPLRGVTDIFPKFTITHQYDPSTTVTTITIKLIILSLIDFIHFGII